MNPIETEGLTKYYRHHFFNASKPSLVDLDLTINEAEIFGFLGKNGAGKTTTIKILCGLLRPTRGSARIFGQDVRERKARKLLGYLPENPYFYEYLTPKETLDFYGRLESLSARQRAREWDELSELLDLREIGNQRIREFSKGMRQRLGFAVALVGDPSVLLLDEPMSGLDPLGRRLIRNLITLMRDRGKTIFFSSHVLGDVEQICDRIGILDKGKLIAQGNIDELLSKEVKRVEIVARHVPQKIVDTLNEKAAGSGASREETRLVFQNIHDANEAAKEIYAAGGELIEFTPLRESLEDFFIREQAHPATLSPDPATTDTRPTDQREK